MVFQFNAALNKKMLRGDEFEKEFELFKENNAPGHDVLDLNIITSVYEHLCISNYC